MLSELSVVHSFQSPGDSAFEAETVPGGLLGADYEGANGRYRFKKVFGGLNWTPDLRSPLTEPGVDVRSGEYLLAVEGKDLRFPDELYQRFEHTADRIVEITVGSSADGKGSRTVKVVPIPDERALRNRDWVEGTQAVAGRDALSARRHAGRDGSTASTTFGSPGRAAMNAPPRSTKASKYTSSTKLIET